MKNFVSATLALVSYTFLISLIVLFLVAFSFITICLMGPFAGGFVLIITLPVFAYFAYCEVSNLYNDSKAFS